MVVSACLVTWNEEELLPFCLQYLNSIPEIEEICVVDSYSTDHTQIILERFKKETKKEFKLTRRHFDNFAQHKNACFEMASGDWILLIDADETYTANLGLLLRELNNLDFSAYRIPTLLMYPDRNHYLHTGNIDPHVRLWKKKFARYLGEVHEVLVDAGGRNIHESFDPDILNTWGHPMFRDVWMKHYQLLKSDESLLAKGRRWRPFFELSAANRIPIHDFWWVENKRRVRREISKQESWSVRQLPFNLFDVTT